MEQELIQDEKLFEFHPKTSLTALTGGRVLNIAFTDITHISKYGHETVIYTAGNSYRTYHSLQEILNDLPLNDFFRIHRSHIVSLRYMNGVRRRRLRAGDYYLPVSNYYKLQLCKSLVMLLNRSYDFYGFTPSSSLAERVGPRHERSQKRGKI